MQIAGTSMREKLIEKTMVLLTKPMPKQTLDTLPMGFCIGFFRY
jgi:hypothetical protein